MEPEIITEDEIDQNPEGAFARWLGARRQRRVAVVPWWWYPAGTAKSRGLLPPADWSPAEAAAGRGHEGEDGGDAEREQAGAVEAGAAWAVARRDLLRRRPEPAGPPCPECGRPEALWGVTRIDRAFYFCQNPKCRFVWPAVSSWAVQEATEEPLAKAA